MRLLMAVGLFLCMVYGPVLAIGQTDIPEDSSFSFVVMADNQPPWFPADRDITAAGDVVKTLLPGINLLSPDFVVTCGDMIGGGVDDVDVINKMWDNYLAVMAALERPHIKLPGNHDVWSPESKKIFEERFGSVYFSFDHKGCHFIALCSEIPGETDYIKGAQLEWLRRDLESAKNAQRIFIFVHKPLWCKEEFPDTAWNSEVHPLLVAAGVDTVFCGHRHVYEWDKRDGIRYIIQGGGGGPLMQVRALGGFYHFLNVTVRGKEATIAVVGDGDRVMPETVITRELVAQAGAFQDALGRSLHYIPAAAADEPCEAKVRLKNTFSVAITGDLVWNPKSAWKAEPSKVSIRLEPGAEQVVTLRLTPGDKKPVASAGAYKITYNSPCLLEPGSAESRIYIVPTADCASIEGAAIDGQLTEWSSLPAISLENGPVLSSPEFADTLESPRDLSAKLWYGWDASNLYITVSVTDDKYFNSAEGESLYDGDGIVIAIDPLNNGRDLGNPILHRFDDDDWQICVARTKSGVEVWGNAQGEFKELPVVKAVVKLTGEGGNAVYEVAVPWSELGVSPKQGMQIGATAKICEDDDGKGRAGVISWTEPNDPAAFGTLTLR